ncbi:unnamed protein product [Oppiella nova]|uniref:Uncharacterized protein n=1 Tax=Oppiella nova TaxID=334625 RepID=A0A7R9L9N8_9ACAR|nr:unnamed protein product [Oppiella nova]CAG2161103.1 unnamed protein product [Oppiella nova]
MGLTPAEIVTELDRFIVGQHKAKKAVSIALRNRCRRKNVEEPLRQEIAPKNILMIGPTGVGKTEIARRLAKLTGSPFLKVEATKFTEVGYVGRDVESIVRDLVEIAINIQKANAKKEVNIAANLKVIDRILDVLVGKSASSETREKWRAQLLNKELDNVEIELDVIDNTNPLSSGNFEIPGISGNASLGVVNISDMIGKAFGSGRTKRKKMLIKDAMIILAQEESEKLIDQEKIIQVALQLVENDGIVFIDEIDKITSRTENKGGEVSREGVQRDLLPLIEGTTVNTKYGVVDTRAFHSSKPSDLLAELQGRLPIRVELKALDKDDMVKILTEPESNLIKQYTALIATEEVELEFTNSAIEQIAVYAEDINKKIEDIGARRLHTILEHLLEDITHISSLTFSGIDIIDVDVQIQISPGIPNFTIVGLADKTIAESKERVRASLSAIAPADLIKEGSHFDLAIACAILTSMGVLPSSEMRNYLIIGELSLDGSILSVNGALPAAIGALSRDKGLICSRNNGREVAWSGNNSILAPNNLIELVNHFKGNQILTAPEAEIDNDIINYPDFKDIRGQKIAKRVLEVAASGTGKSMLAHCLPGILPKICPKEILECSTIASVAGRIENGKLSRARPFRAPHHSCSIAAMVGGGVGKRVKPGEISLAHNGVLFLDELPEFPQNVIESLRQPIETAAMNPCKCGYLGDEYKACVRAPKCGSDYQMRISGPVMDRFDLHIEVMNVGSYNIIENNVEEESSQIAIRVERARNIQQIRYNKCGIKTNNRLDGQLLIDYAMPKDNGQQLLNEASNKFQLSMRAYNRILRVARTIADLDQSDNVYKVHIAEALIDNPIISRQILFGNPDKINVRLSPDGKYISYLAPKDGVLNIWIAPLSDLTKIEVVTDDKERGIRTYEWTYNNNNILYAQDNKGDENFCIYSYNILTKETKLLTPQKGVKAHIIGITDKKPNEILIGLNDRDKKYFDIYKLNLSTLTKELMLKNEQFVGFIVDNDLQLRFASRVSDDGSVEYFQFKDDKWDLYTKVSMEDSANTNFVGFDKKGEVVYLRDSRGRNTAALKSINLTDGKSTLIAEDELADVRPFIRHPVEKTIQVVAVNYDKVRYKILDKSIKDDIEYLITFYKGNLSINRTLTLDDNIWLVAYESDIAPVKYYIYDRTKRTVKFLFNNREALSEVKLAPMLPIIIKSRDGLDLVSYITFPLNTKFDEDNKPINKIPLIIYVHGGPWVRDYWGFDAVHQWLANRNYVVLSINYRGSTGFGKDFVNAGNMEWGGKMHNDLIDGVRWAVENNIADPEKVAIMGGSYGGYAALVGMTMTPGIFACGIDVVGPSNLLTLIKSVPPYWEPMINQFKKRIGAWDTKEEREFLEQRSPLTFVDNIKNPLFIAQGAHDPRVKQAESDQIVRMKGMVLLEQKIDYLIMH